MTRRLADTLAALILSKLVIVAVLSLAVGALAGGTGATPTGASASGGGFASVLGGAALLLLAGLAPWSLFRLLPFLEAGAVGHLEGLSQRARHGAAAPAKGLANVALRASAAGSLATGAVGVVGARIHGSSGPADTVGSTSLGSRPGGRHGGGGSSVAATGESWRSGSTIPDMAPAAHSDLNNRRLADLAAGLDPYRDELPTHGTASDGASLHGPPPDGVPPLRPGLTYIGPLPRQSGAVRPDHFGRDHLGPVLIGGNQRRDGVGS